MNEYLKISYGGLAIFVGRVFSYLASFFITILLTRMLIPNEYGIYSYIISIPLLFFSIFTLGTDIGLLRYVPDYIAKGQGGKAKTIFIITMKILTIAGIFVSIGIYLLSSFLQQGNLIVATIPYFLFALLTFPVSMMFFALRKMQYFILESLIIKIAQLVSIPFLVSAFGVLGAIYAISLPTVFTFVIMFALLQLKFLSKFKAEKLKIGIRALLTFNLPYYISFIVAALTQRGGIFLLVFYSFVFGIAEAGYMHLAFSIIFAVTAIIQSLPHSANPAMIEYCSKKQNKRIRTTFTMLFKYTLLILLPLITASIFVGGYAIEFLFKSKYIGATMPFKILMFATMFGVARSIITPIITFHNKTKLFLYSEIISFITFVTIALALIPKFGSSGAALAFSIGVAIGASYLLHAGMKLGKLEFPFRIVAKLFSGSLVFLGYLFFVPKNLIQLITSFVVLFSVYVILMKVLKVIERTDIERVLTLLHLKNNWVHHEKL